MCPDGVRQDACLPTYAVKLTVCAPLRARKLTNHRKRLKVESFGIAELQKPAVIPGSYPSFTGIAAARDDKVCEQEPPRRGACMAVALLLQGFALQAVGTNARAVGCTMQAVSSTAVIRLWQGSQGVAGLTRS
jgi:hypothetical protein